MKLYYDIVEVPNITNLQREKMYLLLEMHYGNVSWSSFNTDLNEKKWVILLNNEASELVGFSTQMIIIPKPENYDCVVLFSGDTIIEHKYWGSVTLPVAFLELIRNIGRLYSGKKLYWMLISKGLRTYKYLSVFLNEYYPNHLTQTPSSFRELMNYLGSAKFGSKYNSSTGVVEATENDQFLKEMFQPDENTNNAVASFFYSSNPGYFKGNELLCLADLSESNMSLSVQRILRNLK